MADDIRVKFTADGSSYNKQLKELTQQNRTLKSEVDKVKSSTDQNTTAQEKAAKVAEAVQKQVKGQEEYIKALKAEYEKLSQAEGDNSTELLKQEEKINKAEAALNKMNAEMEAAQREADGYGNETEEATKQTQEMDQAARLLAASKLAEFYSKVSEEIQKVTGAAYDAAKELDEGYDTIVKKTGATGAELGKLSESADKVFGRLPVEMADVGTAVGEVNTRFGLTGDELEDVSELFLKFANITDSDVNTAIGTTSRLLKTYGGNIKDADKVLGYFARQSQLTGVDTNTLLSSLDRSGATLREMGLDLQQSTRLLALFEQNGVDSAAAMTGLRKAVIEGAKQGKSFDQVLREASTGIKNATTDAEALQIATELFGTRGAVVMADGLRSGRISIDDLAESMETYGDVVGDTFEATLDPWDKSKVAMNNLKVAGKELAGEALSAIAPLLENVVDLVQKGVKWFKNLPDPVKKTVAVIGLLAAGAGVAFPKVQSLFQTISMFKAANAIKGITGVSDATGKLAGTAGKASGAMAFFTNPVTLGVGAVSALGLALAGLAKHTENMIQAEYGLTEAQKEQIAAAAESRQAAEDMVAARQEAVEAVQAEYDYIENLAREYDTLIDANGKVKAGYEDRASFILGELAKATGQTIEQIKAEIDENGKLKQSIYDTIEAKRAEATLSAYESSYAEAKQKQAQAQRDYAAAVATAAEREKEYNRVMQGRAGEYVRQSEALRQQMSGLDQTSAKYQELAIRLSELDEAYTQERAELATVTKAWDQSKQAVTDAGIAMAQYNTTIKNYEGLSSAIISGDTAKINAALQSLVNNLQTAETGTKDSLEGQYQAAKKGLSDMEAAFKSGAVDKAAVDMARNLVRDAKRELDKFKSLGKDISNGLKDGMTAERTGNDVGQGLIAGMQEKEGAARTGGSALGRAATGGVTSGASRESARQAGVGISGGLRAGIAGGQGAVGSAASAVAGTANTNIKPSYNEAFKAGQYVSEGLAKGIKDKAWYVNSTANNVASVAIKTMKNIAQIKSPSRVFMQIGEYMTEGLAIGMSDTAPVRKAAEVMAKAAMLPTLSFGADGINGKAVSNSLTYGDIVVNVSGAGVQNEELLARKISDQIFRQVQSERMAYR